MNSYDPSFSFVAPVLCDYCESSDHDVHNCPYRDYIDASCASVEKKINDMTDKLVETTGVRIAEYSQCFNQSRENYSESDSGLGSPIPEVSLYDDFEPSYLARPNLNTDMPLPGLEKERSLYMSLSQDLTPHTSSPEDVLVPSDPPTTLNDFCEFKVGEDLENPSELDMSIKFDIEHHDLDESEDNSPESCVEVIAPTKLEFNDDILSIEYNFFFRVGLMSMWVWMWICVLSVNLFLFIPSNLTSFLNLTSLNLLSLRPLSLNILIQTRLLRILILIGLWTLHPLFCLGC